MKNSLAVLLKNKGILKKGKFILRSGIISSYYCDIKDALGDVEILEKLVKGLAALVPEKATCIAGAGCGGIALASLVAYKKKLPLILIRDKAKKYGTKKLIEGYVPHKQDFVCIVDDVFTTGSSIDEVKQKLSYTNAKFTKPVVVLNRSEQKSIVSLLSDKDLI